MVLVGINYGKKTKRSRCRPRIAGLSQLTMCPAQKAHYAYTAYCYPMMLSYFATAVAKRETRYNLLLE